MRNEASPHKPTARTEFIANTGLIPGGCKMHEIVIMAAGFEVETFLYSIVKVSYDVRNGL